MISIKDLVSALDINEGEKRKIGLYRFDEEKSDWIFIGGQGEKNRLEQLVNQMGTYALFYDSGRIPIPKQFRLHQNFPNPFNPITTIRFDLPREQIVALTIYNILGQKIKQLLNQKFEAGYHKTKWNGLNENGINVFFFLMLIALALACKKTVINNSDIRNITGHIDDINAEEGVGVYTYILDDIYTVKDEPNVLPENEVYANSNPNLLQAVIANRILTLTIITGQTGTAQITIRNRSGSVYRDDIFSVSITAIAATEAMTRAVNYFQSAKYELAESHFQLVIVKNVTTLLSDAYMGLGFSRMRLDRLENDYGYNDLKTSRGLNPSNVDAIAGLSLLEYAIMENYFF